MNLVAVVLLSIAALCALLTALSPTLLARFFSGQALSMPRSARRLVRVTALLVLAFLAAALLSAFGFRLRNLDGPTAELPTSLGQVVRPTPEPDLPPSLGTRGTFDAEKRALREGGARDLIRDFDKRPTP